MNWLKADVPDQIKTDEMVYLPFLQWHHGTGLGVGVIANGGWLLDEDRALTAPSDAPLIKTRWGQAYAFPSVQVAVLATRTTWYIGQNNEAQQVSGYQPGAWSRLHVLAYVAELTDIMILTLRSTAARDLSRGLRNYSKGPLAYAQKLKPGMPPCAFWLIIQAGRQQQAGAGQKSTVTPPELLLPDPESVAIEAWLENNFVGEELLNEFAAMTPMIREFKEQASQPNSNNDQMSPLYAHDQQMPSYVHDQQMPPYVHDQQMPPYVNDQQSSPDDWLEDDLSTETISPSVEVLPRKNSKVQPSPTMFWTYAHSLHLGDDDQVKQTANNTQKNHDWAGAVDWLRSYSKKLTT